MTKSCLENRLEREALPTSLVKLTNSTREVFKLDTSILVFRRVESPPQNRPKLPLLHSKSGVLTAFSCIGILHVAHPQQVTILTFTLVVPYLGTGRAFSSHSQAVRKIQDVRKLDSFQNIMSNSVRNDTKLLAKSPYNIFSKKVHET